MLDVNDLDFVRKQAAANLPELVDLLTINRISDARGGMEEAFDISHAQVKARIAERTSSGLGGGEERTFMGREDVLADYVLTLPYDQTVSEKMRVDHQGQLYEIAFVNTGRSYDTVRRCLIRRL